MKTRTIYTLILLTLLACRQSGEVASLGSIERLDDSLDKIISKDARLEVISKGYEWCEGPVWVASRKMLLFSDVPKNTVYKWTEEKGTEVYLTPSGYTGSIPRGGEPGSNGLLIDNRGRLILCQHGDRRIAAMESNLTDPKPTFKSLADDYRGKKFDSPNDVTMDSKGNLYFTDPYYGLIKHKEDSSKAAPYQGVYRVSTEGKVTLLIDSLSAPNGIALSPDDHFLFIGNSDGAKAIWYKYELGDSSVISGKIFYDVTGEGAGAPDGMKIDKTGVVFGSGPGGILIFDPEGKMIGRIRVPQNTANCALADDEKTLFITSDSLVYRLRMR